MGDCSSVCRKRAENAVIANQCSHWCGDRRECLWCNPLDFQTVHCEKKRFFSKLEEIATSASGLLAMTCVVKGFLTISKGRAEALPFVSYGSDVSRSGFVEGGGGVVGLGLVGYGGDGLALDAVLGDVAK